MLPKNLFNNIVFLSAWSTLTVLLLPSAAQLLTIQYNLFLDFCFLPKKHASLCADWVVASPKINIGRWWPQCWLFTMTPTNKRYIYIYHWFHHFGFPVFKMTKYSLNYNTQYNVQPLIVIKSEITCFPWCSPTPHWKK